MNALVARLTKWVGTYVHVRLADKPLPEPEAINSKPRPMTGLWSTLTPEQKARARAYSGSENHGDPKFALKR
jgi:hypothetical protein